MDTSHPIFFQHKHTPTHFRSVICFPPGTGGNFLTSISDNKIMMPNVNEYMSEARGLWLDNDHEQEQDLDILHKRLLLDPESIPTGKGLLGLCHHVPLLSHSVFDLQIDELVIINLSKDSFWVPNTLNRIKWYLNDQWQDKPDLVLKVLENTRYCELLNFAEYESFCAMIRCELGLDIRHTVISYKWMLEAKHTRTSLADLRGFKNFFTWQMIESLADRMHGDRQDYLDRYRGEYHSNRLNQLRARGQVITEIDYCTLFIDLQLPDHGYLSTIDISKLYNYSKANLFQISRIVHCFLDDYIPLARDQLAMFESRLDAAWRSQVDSNDQPAA